MLGHVGASAQYKLAYDKNLHVTLMVRDPVHVEVDFTDIIDRLAKIPILKGKAIVTRYTKCTTYAILMTKGNAGAASVSFTGHVPLPHGVGTVRPGINTAWKTETSAGSWKTGEYEQDNRRYIPLCTVHKLAKGEFIDSNVLDREGKPSKVQRNILADVQTPWGTMDERGYELGFETDDPDMDEWDM